MIGLCWVRQTITVKQRGAISIMVGRPRKSGKRQPNGQLARAYVNPKAQVASQPHRSVVAVKFREMPEAESEFGRLMLRVGVTPAQYAAGMAYAEVVVAFCAVYDVPSPYPHGMDLMRLGVSKGREMPSHVADAIKLKHRRAFEACMEAGDKAQRAVKNHAVRDQPVGDFETLDLLKSGLDKLVKHFGIDPKLQISKSRT